MSNLNFAGGGIHEVAALRSDGALVAGHFDNAAAADAAIAALENYRAVWITLNPLLSLPEGRALNPARLTRGSRAGARHIEKRTSLLFDFDPPRPKGTMSTNMEHEAALAQARECRMWLHSLGWPLLPLCDSGSGAHLRPFVDMDAGGESTRLVQRTLRALKQRYAFVDSTASDLPRLCRYYGTWNRKSAETRAERPWRQSAVLDEGKQRAVTVTELEALCELMRVPVTLTNGDGIARPTVPGSIARQIALIQRWSNEHGFPGIRFVKPPDAQGAVTVVLECCPRDPEHTGTSAGLVFFPDGGRACVCFHNSCKSLPFREWWGDVETLHQQKLSFERTLLRHDRFNR